MWKICRVKYGRIYIIISFELTNHCWLRFIIFIFHFSFIIISVRILIILFSNHIWLRSSRFFHMILFETRMIVLSLFPKFPHTTISSVNVPNFLICFSIAYLCFWILIKVIFSLLGFHPVLFSGESLIHFFPLHCIHRVCLLLCFLVFCKKILSQKFGQFLFFIIFDSPKFEGLQTLRITTALMVFKLRFHRH